MKKSRWRRYVAAVYLLLLAVAVILGLVALNPEIVEKGSSMQNLLLNLSTELAGAVLIFLVVDQIFRLSEQEETTQLIQKIEHLREEIALKFSPLVSEKEMLKEFNFEAQFIDAQQVRIMGYSLGRVLNEQSDIISQVVNRGAKVQMLIVDRSGLAGELMKQHHEFPEFVDRAFERSLHMLKKIQSRVVNGKGVFEARGTSWIPSCRMMIITDSSSNTNAIITINAPSYRPVKLSDSDKRVLILNSVDHPQHIAYFSSQFDGLWEKDTTPITTSTQA